MSSRSGRFRRPGIIAAGTVAITVLTGTAINAWAGPAPSAPAATGGPQAVIVVLRDQVQGAPADPEHVAARTNATAAAQRAVLGRLAGPAPAKVTHYVTGNAFAATVTPAQAQALAADPAVANVIPDKPVPVTPPPATAAAPAAPQRAASASGLAGPATVSPNACSTDRRHPRLEPEALQTLNVRSDDGRAKTAAALGIDGKGVKVAYIADGINPQNKAFLRKNGRSAIVDYKDFYGDGPNAPTGGAEAFGDASSVVAQGNVVYDVAAFANPKVVRFPGGHCYIRVVGVAPGASVVALKAGSELLPNSAILQAIDYAVRVAKVDVLNESFGGDIVPDSSSRNTIQVFNDQAVRAGVTVTVSTGDAGVTSTIGNPSTDPLVISTGATTDARIYEQTGYALATLFGNGRWTNSNVSALSSAGITEGGRTIDVSAPGEADWAACDSSTTTVGGSVVPRFANCTNFHGGLSDIQPFGGTSQSAPLTAGVAALVIQAYRNAHHGASPAPALVKKLITSTARDLGLPGQEQGSGLVDARAAVEAALTYPGARTAPKGVSSTIALSTNQLLLERTPGQTVSGSVRVSDVGTSALKVTPSLRRYKDLTTTTQKVGINASSTTTAPYPTTAAPWVYQKATFTVPRGADRLAASMAWQSPLKSDGTGPVVRLSLFAPDGTYVANTRPQGGPFPANYGFVDVRKPAAGRWTAVFYTPATTGFTGTVLFETKAQKAVAVGSVSRPFTLTPGSSGKVAVSVAVPKVGGDTSYTLSLATSNGHTVAVPVIVRALLPTAGGKAATFAGTVTGGNARGSLAQRFTFELDVPKGRRDLDAATIVGRNTGDVLQTFLVDPQGEAQSVSSNVQPDGKGGATFSAGAQNIVANPEPGRWRLVVIVANPVSGDAIRKPLAGVVAFDQQKVSLPGLPNDATVTLAAGKPVTLTLSVTNTGPTPESVGVDGRLDGLTAVALAPQGAGDTVKLPLSVDDLSSIPAFLVPPGTKSISLSATSTVPAQVELSSPGFGIDVFGDLEAAQKGSLISTATVSETKGNVGPGFWTTYVQEIGPFTDAGAPAGTSTLTASATTQPFDPAVTSSTGDPYLVGVDPKAAEATPVVIGPGQTKTIQVTVTPEGSAGTVVRGVLNVVTPPIGVIYNGTGDVLARLPYSYTIG